MYFVIVVKLQHNNKLVQLQQHSSLNNSSKNKNKT